MAQNTGLPLHPHQGTIDLIIRRNAPVFFTAAMNKRGRMQIYAVVMGLLPFPFANAQSRQFTETFIQVCIDQRVTNDTLNDHNWSNLLQVLAFDTVFKDYQPERPTEAIPAEVTIAGETPTIEEQALIDTRNAIIDKHNLWNERYHLPFNSMNCEFHITETLIPTKKFNTAEAAQFRRYLELKVKAVNEMPANNPDRQLLINEILTNQEKLINKFLANGGIDRSNAIYVQQNGLSLATKMVQGMALQNPALNIKVLMGIENVPYTHVMHCNSMAGYLMGDTSKKISDIPRADGKTQLYGVEQIQGTNRERLMMAGYVYDGQGNEVPITFQLVDINSEQNSRAKRLWTAMQTNPHIVVIGAQIRPQKRYTNPDSYAQTFLLDVTQYMGVSNQNIEKLNSIEQGTDLGNEYGLLATQEAGTVQENFDNLFDNGLFSSVTTVTTTKQTQNQQQGNGAQQRPLALPAGDMEDDLPF